VHDGSSAPFAIFLDLQFLRLLFFVHRRRVVAPFASRTHQTHDICHLFLSSSRILFFIEAFFIKAFFIEGSG
jgi:hypothetical protein